MAATTLTLPLLLLLLVSLLSISSTKSIATFINPLHISSCADHPAFLKCAHDIQSAIIGAAGSVNIGSGAHKISLLLDSIDVAKASYTNVLHFLSSNHIKSDLINSLYSAFNAAIHEIKCASKILHGKTTLSSLELREVQSYLEIANQNVEKCIASLKHPKNNINLSLQSLIDQSINLTALSLKIFGELSGKVSVGSRHH